MKRACAFIPISDSHFYPEGTHIAINSFKRFHPDIDLIIFRQNTIDKVFQDKDINWFNAKPHFAALLEDKYDLIVNIDGDHIFLDRMTEVFDNTDYEVGMPWNFNDYENSSFDNITAEMYLQAGMVASTNKYFWRRWREMNFEAKRYIRKENDVVNLLVYNDMPFLKLKIFDKEKDYYGCKSLGRELEFYIKDGKTYCRGEKVVAYHFARGNAFPKLDILEMPLTDEVKDNWMNKAYYGQTIKIS